MGYLYRLNEYIEYNYFISFRKEYFHTKSKQFLEESKDNLKRYDETISNFDFGCPERTIETYITKTEDLILLKQFEEANKCLDVVIKNNNLKYNLRAYFLKGFI